VAAAPAELSIAHEASIDFELEKMQRAGVTISFRPLATLLRTIVLAVFAVLLLTRLGPFCEAAAQATPIASVMAGCDEKGSPTQPAITDAIGVA